MHVYQRLPTIYQHSASDTEMLGEHLIPPDLTRAQDDSALVEGFLEKRNAAARHLESVQVILRPSSSSQRSTEQVAGLCKNISHSGCGIIGDSAPRVGDVYRIEVPDATSHALHGLHVRCARCHLLDEDAFESGFFFLTPISLSTVQRDVRNASDPLA